MKKLFLLLVLGIFFVSAISVVSAFDWSNGIVSYYKLDETSGTLVIDSTNNINGSLSNVSINQAGILDKSYLFNGIDSYINISNGFTKANVTSYSFWFKTSNATQSDKSLLGIRNTAGGNADRGFTFQNSSALIAGRWDSADGNLLIRGNFSNNQWHHIVVVENSSGGFLYYNGVLANYSLVPLNYNNLLNQKIVAGARINNGVRERFFNGYIDEIGFWNRSLSASEITELYNSGGGLPYGGSGLGQINLENPLNNSIFSEAQINFTASGANLSSQGFNWTNITLYIWNSTGLFNTTFINIVDNSTFNQTILVSGFSIGNYLWNVQGCFGNSTFSNCTFANQNYSFDWRPFEIVSQSYSPFVFETDYQRFNLTILTLPEILTVTSKLNYGGVLYDGTTSCSSGTCNIFSKIDIPLVSSGENQNKSFYWQITVFDGTNSYNFNTIEETKQQNVTRIHLEKCNATYTIKAVNFTAYREDNLTIINPFSIAGTFQTWLGTGSVKRTQSFQNATSTSLDLCLTPTNRTQFTNAQIEYSFNNENVTFVPRNYYFQNASLTNVTQDIRLLLLEAEDSTTFIIKVQDQKLSPVEDAMVYIQKYYPSDGTFRTVQIAKTDSNGETVGFYEAETVDYKHIIVKDGVTLLETSQQKVVGKDVPFTLTFTVGTALGYPWLPFEKNNNIFSSLLHNKTTNIVTFTYIDTTGATTSARLLVIKPSASNSSYQTICDLTSTQSSATLSCNMSNYQGSFVAYGYIETETTDILNFLISTARDIFAREGLLIALFIYMVAGFAFIWSPVAGIVSINSAIILTNIIGFTSFSPIFIFGGLAVSLIAIILLKS